MTTPDGRDADQHSGHGYGQLYGISLGPGDPELITVKGLRLLQAAPVVAFPAGMGGKVGMAQAIAADWLRPHQIQLPLTFPYTRDQAVLEQAWQTAAAQVWPYLAAGQDVAFIAEGDVSFYSTFTYLAETLQQQQPDLVVQRISGVCSPLAAAGALGMPLTCQSQRLAVLPALYQVDELAATLAWADVVVLMKVSSVYDQVWQVLREHQLLDRAWVIEWIGLPQQRIYRGLGDRPHLDLAYFSLLIVQVKPL